MLNFTKLIVLSFISCVLISCATNPSTQTAVAQPGMTTPPIDSNSYMYRSPPTAALQAHGLAR